MDVTFEPPWINKHVYQKYMAKPFQISGLFFAYVNRTN